MDVIFFFGCVLLALAGLAFASDIAVKWWERWDDQRRQHRLDDVESWHQLQEDGLV